MYVVNNLTKPLLGLPAIEALDLIHQIDTVTQQDTNYIAEFPSVFSGLGLLNDPYHIELQTRVTLYLLSTPQKRNKNLTEWN